MLYGIIDLGSNSIRLNVYDCQQEHTKLLFSKKETAGIISYIKKGILNEEGITLLCTILKGFQTVLSTVDVKVYRVFSTAALRNLKNAESLIRIIQETCGIAIDLLSGEEEGALSFYGASLQLQQQEGLLIDVGGGSSELVYFKDHLIQQVFSIPVGSLSMFNRYISKILPKGKEQEAIRERIHKEIVKEMPVDFPITLPFLCGVGGTMRAITSLLEALAIKDPCAVVFPANDFQTFYNTYKSDPRAVCHAMLKTRPDRIHTLLPGLFIVLEIITFFQCEQLQVSNYGVREGYLYQKVLKNSIS